MSDMTLETIVGMMRQGETLLIEGGSATGKSFLAARLAYSIFRAHQANRAVILTRETIHRYERRIQAWSKYYGDSFDPEYCVMLGDGSADLPVPGFGFCIQDCVDNPVIREDACNIIFVRHFNKPGHVKGYGELIQQAHWVVELDKPWKSSNVRATLVKDEKLMAEHSWVYQIKDFEPFDKGYALII